MRERSVTRGVVLAVGVGGLTALLLSGCASTSMKGTPLYTGEYETREGPVEERVNIWPLFYYRKPALSILWPLVEVTDAHLAVRPIYSMHGRDQEKAVHNVLWPLARFNNQTGNHRIFPVFWGKNYCTAFPLYWHVRTADSVSDTLFPLWSHYRRGGEHSTHALWPFLHRRNLDGCSGGRVFPLYGHYQRGERDRRFFAWPLGHQWSDTGSESGGSMLFPFYYHNQKPNASTFLSLPYSRARKPDGSGWDLAPPFVFRSDDPKRSTFLTPLYMKGANKQKASDWSLLFPLYYRSNSAQGSLLAGLPGARWKEGNTSGWMIFPLLAGGESTPEQGQYWGLGPLMHKGWDADSSSSHIFPFYYRTRTADRSFLLSLPWSSGRSADGSSWQMVPPLLFREKRADGTSYVTVLFYWNSETRTFVSPLYARFSSGQADYTAVPPLLSWHVRDEKRSDLWGAGGLMHFSWGEQPGAQHVLPLFYRNPQTGLFVSLPFAQWQSDSGRKTAVVPPLLSWLSRGAEKSDLWLAGPLAHFSWGEKATAQHVFPLFYHNRKSGTVVSPLWARWHPSTNRTTTVVPPLLSWKETRKDRSDLWMVGPLAHFSWGEKAAAQHIFPLYYYNRTSGTFVSPLWASWREGRRDIKVVPPLLSWHTAKGDEESLTALLGLFRQQWGGDKPKQGHLFPLYSYTGDKRLLTPLFGWDKDPRNGYYYPLTPLYGRRRGENTGSWLFPLYSHKYHTQRDEHSGTFLWGNYRATAARTRSQLPGVFTYRNVHEPAPELLTTRQYATYGKAFDALLLYSYRNQLKVRPDRPDPDQPDVSPPPRLTDYRKNRLFPLWSASHRTDRVSGAVDSKRSLLLALYDHMHERSAATTDTDQAADDYTRARVLWRLWHYERLNGDVSVDIFPGITYDRKTDGFKKVSFLWRLFRYEKGPQGKKLDLLFIPLMRKKAEGEALNDRLPKPGDLESDSDPC